MRERRVKFASDQVFARTAGAPLLEGNEVRLLCDACENYPAWKDAIAAATRYVHFEIYIFTDDEAGREFAELLKKKALEGVAVRVIYDWMGGLGKTPGRFWKALRDAGAEVRCFNPPNFGEPLGWLRRDHRKCLVVDGEIAFVTGLCIGNVWTGDEKDQIAPWRDTGVALRGPAVREVALAFAEMWSNCGDPLPPATLPLDVAPPDAPPPAALLPGIPATNLYCDTPPAGEPAAAEGAPPVAPPAATAATPLERALKAAADPAAAGPLAAAERAGNIAVRVVAASPGTGSIFRLDLAVASAAERTLWLTDAYYAGTSSYVQALRAAAQDGVDVRLLVPGRGSDIALVQSISRAGYRSLLEAGVRVFEWNGPMIHAKSAVADGRWARVGSTNLNLASFIGNWELDVVIEDDGFAREMEEQYLEDLASSTEILLEGRSRVKAAGGVRPRRLRGGGGSASRAAMGAVRMGRALSAVMTSKVLGPAEARLMERAGAFLIVLGPLGILLPQLLAWPIAFFALWMGISLLVGALRARKSRAPKPPARA